MGEDLTDLSQSFGRVDCHLPDTKQLNARYQLLL
jgi:hypothetical protein